MARGIDVLDSAAQPRQLRRAAGGEPFMPRKIQGYGWTPDLPDSRDLLYAAPVEALEALPRRVELRKQCPPVYDHGQPRSSAANAIGAALEFDQMKQK